MPRQIWQDPFASTAISLLQDPARARAAAVEKIGEANARAAEIAGQAQAAAQLQGGNALANAQQQGGQIWGNAIQGLGQIPGQVQQQIQQAQKQSRRAAMEKLQIAQMQRQNETAQRIEEAKQRINALASDPDVLNADGTFNAQGLVKKISAGLPNGASGPVQPPDIQTIFGLIDPINDSLTKARAAKMAYEDHRTNALARLASSVFEIGKHDGNYLAPAQIGMAAAVKSGLATQDEANQFLVPMIEHPESAPALLQAMIGRSTLPPIKLSEKERLVSGLDPTKTLVEAQPETKFEQKNVLLDGKPAVVNFNPATGKHMLPTGEDVSARVSPIQPTKALEQKAVLLDGKPALVNFDPASGKHTLPGGEDVSARVKPIPPQAAVTVQQNQSEAKNIADAIISGDQPPDMRSLYRLAGPIRSELAKSGYNLTSASLDWEATKKHVTTLNGAQQLRLNQAINQLPDLLDSVDTLASQWKGGQFPVLNKANLALAKNGAFGEDVASVARKLDTQIADVNADLGTVYMGGNSPTDHALKLAQTALAGDWSEKVIHDMVALAKSNVQIRQNSIRNTGVAGASANNPYAPAPATQPAPAAPTIDVTRGPNGQLIIKR